MLYFLPSGTAISGLKVSDFLKCNVVETAPTGRCVVIVKFTDGGWAAYFCSDAEVLAREILETIADRWAIEEFFHDTKEVWGAGQQQVRNVAAELPQAGIVLNRQSNLFDCSIL